MNEILNEFLLAGDKFMPEVHLKRPEFFIVFLVHLLKTKKEFKNSCKQEIQINFIGMILIKLFSNKIHLMVRQLVEIVVTIYYFKFQPNKNNKIKN